MASKTVIRPISRFEWISLKILKSEKDALTLYLYVPSINWGIFNGSTGTLKSHWQCSELTPKFQSAVQISKLLAIVTRDVD